MPDVLLINVENFLFGKCVHGKKHALKEKLPAFYWLREVIQREGGNCIATNFLKREVVVAGMKDVYQSAGDLVLRQSQ